MSRMHRVMTVIAVLGSSVWTAIARGEDAATDVAADAIAFANRILDVTDVVLQNHIDPPTRQEMILAGVKALFRTDGGTVPNQLSARVSQLAERDEMAASRRWAVPGAPS